MNEKNLESNADFSGERFLPSLDGGIALEHWHRYATALEAARKRDVLDIACGEGYGSRLLSTVARRVFGVDVDVSSIDRAKKKYKKKNLEFLVGECASIPLESNSVDLVVSFETLEHHRDHEEMMLEIKRVLRPSGCLIISTPDKFQYSVVPGLVNPYHLKELYEREFRGLIERHFARHTFYGQRLVYGSVIFNTANHYCPVNLRT